MALEQGLNKPYDQGLYVSDANSALYDYKVFHKDTDHLTYIIFTNLRTGKTYGPMELPDENLDLSETIKEFLDKKASELYPNT
ncbi:hypothetical protein ACO11K_003645 [Bacillus cytotoxicus]|uniref:hypothetical protein n=1 Tax=Bacillus cereus group TaxID=86661 RepID=UPI001F574240|nr:MULTISPECIES: hypothetical protein [unclassified Bacillus cereus group]